jgi:hypothetical protein
VGRPRPRRAARLLLRLLAPAEEGPRGEAVIPTTSEATYILARIAYANPEAIPLALQLLGMEPCKRCRFVKKHCRCRPAPLVKPCP